jgi:predicted RNase H-like HicB family nuclease
MPVHEEVLAAARRIVNDRPDWTFALNELVRALAHLNVQTVTTHVVSRCCVNAPANHQHRWPYFRHVARGRYRIEPKYRSTRVETPPRPSLPGAPLKDSIHAVIAGGAGAYTAECLEVAVVTEGRSLDETLRNLHEALALHLEGEDLASLGLAPRPRLLVTHESVLGVVA